jgi:hypothetical protein
LSRHLRRTESRSSSSNCTLSWWTYQVYLPWTLQMLCVSE